MAEILSGKEVAAAMLERMKKEADALKEAGTVPTLGIIRVGEDESSLSYERGAVKRAQAAGAACKKYIFPGDVAQDELLRTIDVINDDGGIHGVLLFRPLPPHIDSRAIENALKPEKDVDCMTDMSLCGIFTGNDIGYPPCTPQACLEILDYYGISCAGKNVAVIGRSLVVGKPLSMMLINRNATVTVCHTKTKDMKEITRAADIVIAAAGRAKIIDGDYVRPGQTVIDVGINVDEDGNLCGDVDYTSVEPIVSAITPVPGGVGSVTTSVLISHVIKAAKKNSQA